MAKYPNIYLIGPLGVGKSSVGKRLAKLTGHQFIDTDHEISERSGVDLNWIYEVEGEQGYRKREAQIILELTQQPNTMLSTGGGAVLVEEVRHALEKTGLVIYLQVSFEQQLERTKRRRGTRPVLEDGEVFHDRLLKLNHEREPLYESIATQTFSTNNMSAYALAKKIWNHISK